MDNKELLPDEPENFVMFGDGYFAGLFHQGECNDSDKMMYEFHLKPTKWLRFFHNIHNKEDPDYDANNGFFRKRYHQADCVPLSATPKHNVWIVTKDWNGKMTAADTLFEAKLRQKLKFFMDRCSQLEAENWKLKIDLQQSIKFPHVVMMKNVQFFEEVKKVVGPVTIGSGGQYNTPIAGDNTGGG